MLGNLRQSVADWIFRARSPEAPPVTLVQRRIFILPSRQGYFFAGTLLILLLASIQYALSLGYLLTFLLAAMGSVAMLHTWRNLAHLKLRPGRCEPVFAGDTAHFGVLVDSPVRARYALAIRRRDDEPVFVDAPPGEAATVALRPAGDLHALSARPLPRVVLLRFRPVAARLPAPRRHRGRAAAAFACGRLGGDPHPRRRRLQRAAPLPAGGSAPAGRLEGPRARR
jgi:hypothetical protein